MWQLHFTLKQGETRTNSVPIPHPLMELRDSCELIWKIIYKPILIFPMIVAYINMTFCASSIWQVLLIAE